MASGIMVSEAVHLLIGEMLTERNAMLNLARSSWAIPKKPLKRLGYWGLMVSATLFPSHRQAKSSSVGPKWRFADPRRACRLGRLGS